MNVLNSDHRLVQLRFKPLWLYVDQVREFCSFFASATFDDHGMGERISIVVHELVENAIRHGDERELELSMERTPGVVVVRVSNTTSDDGAHKLREAFDEMNALPAEQAYAAAIERSISLPEGQSGLGLSRVRHEGRVELVLEAGQGRVSISARGEL